MVLLIEQAQRAGKVDLAADPEALGGLVLATHRGIEALIKAGVDTTMTNRIADAAIDSITLEPTPRNLRTSALEEGTRQACRPSITVRRGPSRTTPVMADAWYRRRFPSAPEAPCEHRR